MKEIWMAHYSRYALHLGVAPISDDLADFYIKKGASPLKAVLAVWTQHRNS